MPLSEARKRANKKWDAAHMATVTMRDNRDKIAAYKAAAARAGTTISAVMRKALDKLLEEYPDTGDSSTPQATDTDT